MRILVKELHVGMSGSRVEVEVVFLDVLAVIPLVAAQAEEALLQDRIATVPQGQREAHQFVAIREAREAVFAPAIGSRARVVVREVLPGCPVRAVVFTNRAPLSLAQVGPPALPVSLALA